MTHSLSSSKAQEKLYEELYGILNYADTNECNYFKENIYFSLGRKLFNDCTNIQNFEGEKKANGTISFAKRANILKILLEKCFDNDNGVVKELSRRQQGSQYVYSNKIIISAFAKYKRSVDANKDLQDANDKNRKIVAFYVCFKCVFVLTVFSVVFGTFGLENRAMIVTPTVYTLLGIYAAVVLTLCVLYNHSVVSKESCEAPTVAWLQKELAAEQKSQSKTTVSEEQQAEPGTSIKTQDQQRVYPGIYPDLSNEMRKAGLVLTGELRERSININR